MDYKIGNEINGRIIVEFVKRGKYNGVYLKCQKCGRIVFFRIYQLKNTTRCMCERIKYREKDEKLNRIYRIYHHMRWRCENKNCEAYKNYGRKGISVCEEWKSDFMSFFNWAINNGYDNDLTIDRIDVTKGYTPDNCRWITKSENTAIANRCTQRRFASTPYYAISPNGEKYIFTNANKFCEEYDLPANVVRKYSKLNKSYNGWKLSRDGKLLEQQ